MLNKKQSVVSPGKQVRPCGNDSYTQPHGGKGEAREVMGAVRVSRCAGELLKGREE